jgi:hypothetical protein
LNVHRVSDVRQIEIRTAEPLVPEPSPFEVEIAIAIINSIWIPDQWKESIIVPIDKKGDKTP